MNLFPASRSLTLEAAFRDVNAKKVELRMVAADVLGDVRDPEFVEKAAEALCGALGDLRPEMRTTAALALGDMEQGLAVEPLVATLDDQVAEVRQAIRLAPSTVALSPERNANELPPAEPQPDPAQANAGTVADNESDSGGTEDPLNAVLRLSP